MTHLQIRTKIEIEAQNIFNKYAKPQIIKQMKSCRVKAIESIMGVTFYTLNSGTSYSDTEITNRYPNGKIAALVNTIDKYEEGPFYSLININTKI